ncbi:glycoside hydrolase family 95 protein [Ruminiclostridium cellobioparum]|uniref:glycoside hydrolase family 95 protein n=1 Tax=Ruminiclostridium cellobioparum TaxID=29355 RepID=UPI000688A1C7|nr:glycoside hydrolase family 95 protein [Ruminiclostridium cellobioparum]
MNLNSIRENNKKLTLWYKQPAVKWQQALPLGNGHMGAMVHGGINTERIELTENTCYSGEASGRNNQEGAAQAVPEIRKALFKHDYKTAGELCEKITGRRLNYGTNLPFGNLLIDFENCSDGISGYSRELQLNNALSVVNYKAGEVQYSRELFVSHPRKLAVMRLSSSIPGKLSFTASIDGAGNPFSIHAEGSDLVLDGNAFEYIHSDGKTGVAIHGRLRVVAEEGISTVVENSISVSGAGSALILLAIGTDFAEKDIRNACKDRIDAASEIAYETLKDEHIKDHRSLFGRVVLEFEGECGLWEDSALPAHLQGIWNDNVACSMGWTCDMHLDINTEMNYWPSEVTNLSECNVPLFKWIEERLVPSGQRTAQVTYGLEGWTAHVVSNAWGYTAPGWAASWGINVTGGLWVATHLWEHYLYTGDREFLCNRLYPVYREAVKFFLKYLEKDPGSGYYLSGPSMSPENSFVHDWNNPVECSNSMGTVCDTVMIRELFTSFISTCQLLGINDELLGETKEKLGKLPPFKIGARGQLQEWFYDYDEPDAHHRHTSHLLSVYPCWQISPETTPELAQAAKVSIRRRTTPAWRWEDTGWARALLILYSARLLEAENTYRHILAFQRGLTNDNLLSFCPPGAGAETDVYEMDGTTGLCSGIAEALLQSHNNLINILPALPEKWGTGYVKGLRARGGYTVGIVWRDNELESIELEARKDTVCTIKYKDRKVDIPVVKGERYLLDRSLKVIPG